MEESPEEYEFQEHDGRKSGGLLAKWRACLLLFVMLLGLLATPLTLLFRWYAESTHNELKALLEGNAPVNRIAFITPEGQLATMAPDGGAVHRLTDETQGFEFPAWSPDGQKLAVTGGGKVLVFNLEDGPDSGGSQFSAYENPDERPFYLYWSPDSRYIAFLAGHSDGVALHLAQGQGGEPESRLLATGEPFYWGWSPTANELLIHSGGLGRGGRLETIDLLGDTTADDFGAAGVFQAPGFSYDGLYRAYAALDEAGRSRLVVQDANGERQQFDPHFGQLAFTWSPVDELLAVMSPRQESRFNSGPLGLVDPRSGDVTLLSNQNVLAFFWSPDGHTIAYFSLPGNGSGDVRIAAAAGKEASRARLQRQQGELRMDLWVVDAASGRQRRLAQFAPTALFVHQFLPHFDQYALSHRLWSPNSDALVFPVFEDGRSQIAVVPLQRGGLTLVADGEIAFWSQN